MLYMLYAHLDTHHEDHHEDYVAIGLILHWINSTTYTYRPYIHIDSVVDSVVDSVIGGIHTLSVLRVIPAYTRAWAGYIDEFI